MNNFLSAKINIGISACQFGSKIRYNSKGQDITTFMGREKSDFIWHPVCPEVLSGMGVPRNPVSLRGGNGDDFWKGTADIKNRGGTNLNDWVKEGVKSAIGTLKRANVKVYIFMEGSPTCGVYRTSLKNKRLGHPPGIFGSLLLKEGFFLIPSSDLQSALRWWDWRRRMFAFLWIDDQSFDKISGAVNAWHVVKFLVQELSRKEADIIGKTLAQGKSISKKELSTLKREIQDILRRPSSTAKIKQSLWKSYAFMRKHFGMSMDNIKMPAELRGFTHIAEELRSLEIESRKEDYLFGASPVYYKMN
ncbi:MAG: DUF523 domain-containing protein [Spirochaetes bacterium]|nr:DUF523 domain-containing protein [Spirochaetota bacterium]MBN2769405.1 DUF523 domain-containing protein [Spirochaetota bacterium]